MRAVWIVPWLPLIGLLATMSVFAVRVRGGPRDADVARRPASVLLGFWLRDWMVWALSPLEHWLVRRRVSPDALNWAGAALGLLAGAGFILRQLPPAAWLIALAGIADILDGRIARARGMASAYGGFLDSTLDRFSETFTFVGVAWYLAGSAWTAAATALAIGGSLLVSYTRARGEALGVTCTGGLAQRAERLVLLALATLLDATVSGSFGWRPGAVLGAAVAVIAVGSLATAVYRTVVIARVLARRADPAAPGVTALPQERGTGAAARR
ncbi:MAG TPA: CDP-alcohol phosphatidyltransferase family protein [Gemmatimonadales bacterium]|nr:CDP-alcohol phosphatidyltransferase family protein [Gemmatimonadales bacterium]